MHTATWLALQDELEKIAVSRKWALEKALSGGFKRGLGVSKRPAKFSQNTMRGITKDHTFHHDHSKGGYENAKASIQSLKGKERQNKLRGVMDAASLGTIKGEEARKKLTSAAKTTAKATAGVGGALALGYGAKKLHDHSKEKTAVSEKWIADRVGAAASKAKGMNLVGKARVANFIDRNMHKGLESLTQGKGSKRIRAALAANGKTKTALLGPALDMAGLGFLAAPTIQKMRGKPMSDKNKDRAELGGLGVLGASVAAEHGGKAIGAAKKGLGALKGLASRIHPK